MIYLVQHGEDGPIKIGFAETDVVARIKDLQAGTPVELRLLGTTKGTRTRESRLHRRFKEGRIRGEWFRPDTPELAEFVEHIQAEGLLVASLGFGYCEECDELVIGRKITCSERCAKKRSRAMAYARH